MIRDRMPLMLPGGCRSVGAYGTLEIAALGDGFSTCREIPAPGGAAHHRLRFAITQRGGRWGEAVDRADLTIRDPGLIAKDPQSRRFDHFRNRLGRDACGGDVEYAEFYVDLIGLRQEPHVVLGIRIPDPGLRCGSEPRDGGELGRAYIVCRGVPRSGHLKRISRVGAEPDAASPRPHQSPHCPSQGNPVSGVVKIGSEASSGACTRGRGEEREEKQVCSGCRSPAPAPPSSPCRDEQADEESRDRPSLSSRTNIGIRQAGRRETSSRARSQGFFESLPGQSSA